MPTEEKLAYEITLARNDLEQNIADLKDAVADELDVGKQAHRVLDAVKEKAALVANEQVFRLRMFASQKRREIAAYVRANPEKSAAIAGGMLAALIGGIVLYRRRADGSQALGGRGQSVLSNVRNPRSHSSGDRTSVS